MIRPLGAARRISDRRAAEDRTARSPGIDMGRLAEAMQAMGENEIVQLRLELA